MTKDKIENTLITHWNELKDIVNSITQNAALSEDVLQDAFIKAITTKSGPRSETKILPWFKQILRNTAMDTFRRQGKERPLDLEKLEKISEQEDVNESICSCVKRLVKELRKTDNEIITELDFNEKSLTQLEGETGIAKTTLKVRHHRAKKNLKELLIKVCNIGSAGECEECEC